MDNQLENEGTASGTVGSASTNPLLKRNREEEKEEETDGEAGVDGVFYLSSSYKAALALGNPLPREGGDESDESAQWSNTTAYTNMEDDREASAPTITLPAAAAAKPASLLAPSISNFAVQYNFQDISVAKSYVMSDVYAKAGWVDATTASVAMAGAIVGQLAMGLVGDLIGVNRALRLTLVLTAAGALLSAVLPWGDATSAWLIVNVCRFLLGVGVGGVYPLSATKAAQDAEASARDEDVHVDAASEDAGKVGGANRKAFMVTRAFFWQTPGAMAPFVMALVLHYSIGEANEEREQLSWRLLLGLGVVPSLLVLLFTDLSDGHSGGALLKQTELASKDEEEVESDARLNARPRAESLLPQRETAFEHLRANPATLKCLVGCSLSWFLYDVCYYGVFLLVPDILRDIYGEMTLATGCWLGLLTTACGLPGILLTMCIVRGDMMRMKQIQILSFAIIAVSAGVLGGIYAPLHNSGQNSWLFGVVCLLAAACNFGANVTTFVLPSQLFPKSHRSTLNGIAAASGKAGAMVGAFGLEEVVSIFGFEATMAIVAVTALISIGVTQSLIPDGPSQESPRTEGAKHAAINEDDEDDRARLVVN